MFTAVKGNSGYGIYLLLFTVAIKHLPKRIELSLCQTSGRRLPFK